MIIQLLGLIFLWGTIIFTVTQKNDILWIISALCSILLMHFISKWVKIGGLSRLGLQMKKGWLRFLLLGSLVGIAYQLVRFSVMYSSGTFSIHNVSVDISSLVISTIILLISTAYIGFTEEIVFRGYLINMFPALSKFVVVISAVLFTSCYLLRGSRFC